MPAEALPRLEDVDVDAYDFLDFGAGKGDSVLFCQKRLDARRGLGIDIDPRKIALARDSGVDVVLGDIRKLPLKASVRFVSMMDFLEHLPTFDDVSDMVSVAVRCARDFLFVRHPSFEDEAYLSTLGLRQYWQDWSGHPSHLLLSDFAAIFQKLGLPAWNVRFKRPVFTSADASIIPVSAPRDQHHYDPNVCGPKPHLTFAKPVFRQLDLVVCLSTEAFEQAPAILDRVGA